MPEHYGLRTVSLVDENLEVQGAQLMCTQYEEAAQQQREKYSPDYIFVGFTSELPDNPSYAPHDCVCVLDSPLPLSYQNESLGINLLLVDTVPSERVLMLLQNHIAFLLSDEFRYYRKKEQIVSAELAQYDLGQAIQLVEKLVLNPILLINPDGKILAVGSRYLFTDSALMNGLRCGQIPLDLLLSIRNTSVYLPLEQDYMAQGRQLAYGFQQYLCVPVQVQGILVAEIIIQNWITPFSHSLIRLMPSVSHLFSGIIARRMEEHNDRALLHNLLFAALLRAAPEQELELTARIQELDWKNIPGMQLLCCKSRTGHAETAFAQLRRLYPSARWTLAGDIWLLLLYPEDKQPLSLTTLEKQLEQKELYGGISWPFDNLLALKYAYEQAKAALLSSNSILTEYASVFATHMASQPVSERLHYLHPSIVSLAKVNKQYEGNLLATLEAYLAGPEQPVEVAAKLFISRSTLFYRLNRIRELCIIDWSTGEERMNLLLSIRTMRSLGVLD